MDTALASLRGSAPLVRLHFEIQEDKVPGDPSESEVQVSGSVTEASESAASSLLKEGAMSLMVSKFLQCSTNCINIGTAEEWFRRQVKQEKLVTVTFEIAGGVNLKIPSPSKKNKRVPSQEALEIVAGKMKLDSLHKNNSAERSGASASSVRSVSDTSMSRDLTQDEHYARLLKKQKRAREVFGERSSLCPQVFSYAVGLDGLKRKIL